MSNDLTEDVIQEYQEAFQLFDKDGNGHIEAKGNIQPQPVVFVDHVDHVDDTIGYI